AKGPPWAKVVLEMQPLGPGKEAHDEHGRSVDRSQGRTAANCGPSGGRATGVRGAGRFGPARRGTAPVGRAPPDGPTRAGGLPGGTRLGRSRRDADLAQWPGSEPAARVAPAALWVDLRGVHPSAHDLRQ